MMNHGGRGGTRRKKFALWISMALAGIAGCIAPPLHAGAFVSYIRELRAALPKDKSLHIAVFPPVGMPEAWRGFHNLPELALAGDGIVVMLYDYHRPGTAPGCVSGISWLKDNARTLADLPREKIWLGAPLYGYYFNGKTARAISKSQFERRRGSRSEADGCYRIQSAAGETYYPSQALYAAYDRLVRENRFAGVAYWALPSQRLARRVRTVTIAERHDGY